MGKNASDKYIDKYALSQAFLEYVYRQLSEAGYESTNTVISQALEVQPSMISQVANGKKALAYETIARYATRTGKHLGKLLLEVTRLAGEAVEIPLIEAPVSQSTELLDEAIEKTKFLSELIQREITSEGLYVEQLYKRLLAHLYGFFKDSALPIVAVAIGILRRKQWQFLVCNQVKSDEPVPVKVSEQAPPHLIKVLECCGQEPRDSEKAKHGYIVHYPGQGGAEAEVNDAADNEKVKWIPFWKEFTNLSPGYHGRKIRIIPEPVFGVWDNNGDSYSLMILFLFAYHFKPPRRVREAMSLLTRPALEIQANEFYVQLQQGAGTKSSLEPLHPVADKRLCQSTFWGAMQDLCELLWATYSAPWISKVEALNVHRDDDRRQQYFETDYRTYMQASGKNETQKLNQGAKEYHEKVPEAIEKMTAYVLHNAEAVLFDPAVFEGKSCPQRSNSERRTVIGLPFVNHGEEQSCGVLYLWYNADYSTKMAEIISSLASKFHKVEICCPADLKVRLSSSQRQPHRISQQPVFLEIDESIGSRI